MHIPIGYVDPGTGATMMQLVLAGTVGVSAIIKLKWNSIRGVFQRSDATTQEESESAVDRDKSPA